MFFSINVKIIYDFKLSCPVESKCTTQLYLNFNNLISKVKLSFPNSSINELKFDDIFFESEFKFLFSYFYLSLSSAKKDRVF